MESGDQYPGSIVRLVSPKFPNSPHRKCLKFNYNVYGRNVGKISILDANSVELWHRDGKAEGMYAKINTVLFFLFLTHTPPPPTVSTPSPSY